MTCCLLVVLNANLVVKIKLNKFIPHLSIKPEHERVFLVTDLHGNLKGLLKLLDKIGYDSSKDLLISLGDLIDRGDESLSLLMYFIDNPNRISLAGNHEDMMIDALFSKTHKHGRKAMWDGEGGAWAKDVSNTTLTHIGRKIQNQFAYTATLTLRCGTRFGLTHGDIVGDRWLGSEYANLDEKELSKFLWGRNRAKKKFRVSHSIKDVDFTVHGHTPSEEPYMFYNSIFMDTGAAYKDGRVTAIELNEFSKNKSLLKSCVCVKY